METTKMVSLESGQYNKLKEITIRGVKVMGSLSPYDIPRQAKISYDQDENKYRIHFVYLTPYEPTQELKASPEILMYVGESSGKLYDIVVQGQEPASVVDIKFKVISGVDDLARRTEGSSPFNYIKKLNLSVAKKLLEDNQELYALAG